MDKRYDPLPGLAGLVTAALNWRNDTGVYASAIARELGLTIEDEEATVLARLQGAIGRPAAGRVKITVTLDCGHVLTYMDSIEEKYPFYCEQCREQRIGKYPWKLTTEIVFTGPTVINPHDEGTSYCTSLPLHDHDRPGETCPAYRTDDNGDRWPCIRPWIHNYPDGMAERVHTDQFGTEFRVGRCQVPAVHGMPHCWCATPGHHKPLKPELCDSVMPLPNGGLLACIADAGHYGAHTAIAGKHRWLGTGADARTEEGQLIAKPRPGESAARTYLLGCGCQVTPTYGATVGAPYVCAVHGDTTVTMTIPLGAATCEGGC